MRYHHEKPSIYASVYNNIYECEHPVYNKCTLFKIDQNGLSVIQQRYDNTTNHVALKMKLIPRERWETCFDRRFI